MNGKNILTRQRLNSFLSHPRLVALSKPQNLFLSLAIPFGFIFILLIAPFQTPDEHMHFFRAYAISTGQLTGINLRIPESVNTFTKTVAKGLPGNDQNKQSKKQLLIEIFRPFQEQPQVEVSIINSAIVSPLPYLPQSIGVLIGRLARLNPIFIHYLGRIVNFLTWTGLIYLAIRITPIHPRLFTALALMPMALQQAASNSPDAMTIAISFLFVAYTLRVLFAQKITIRWKDWAILCLLVIAVALCKSIYLSLAGLLLAVPFRHFRQQRSSLFIVLMIIGLGLAAGLAWMQYTSEFMTEEMMNKFRTPTTAGLKFIIQNPQTAAPILWRSAITYTEDQMRMFIGVLGWADTDLPNWVYPLYYALLFFTVIFEPHPHVFFNVRERLWVACLAVTIHLLILSLFFYPDRSIARGIIDVVQGRYFIPFGAFYFLPFSQRKWSISNNSPVWYAIVIIHILVFIVAIRALLWRYYAI